MDVYLHDMDFMELQGVFVVLLQSKAETAFFVAIWQMQLAVMCALYSMYLCAGLLDAFLLAVFH